ncbi:MAG: hypothetical protein LBD23_18630 [Oscillospiraceae bacterium]|jgi:hypothetical protein|nr:hypothetical protein [Oscillospiraceae bacterium]
MKTQNEYIDNRLQKTNIIGSSMEPILRNGDVGFLIEMPKYTIGEIIVFKYAINKHDKLLAHRIVNIEKNYYHCKGDNSLEIEKVELSAVLGKLALVKRNGNIVKIDMDEAMLNEFCKLSLKCGNAWEAGNKMLAETMAKRCYIFLLKSIDQIAFKKEKSF